MRINQKIAVLTTTILLVSILLIIIIDSGIYSEIIESFDEISSSIVGNYKSKDGYLINEISIADKKRIANANYQEADQLIESVSNHIYKYHDGKIQKIDVNRTKVSFTTVWNGQKEIDIKYINMGDNVVFLNCTDENICAFIKLESNINVLFEFCDSVYLLDPLDMQTDSLLEVKDEKEKNEILNRLKQKNSEEFSLIWGVNPYPDKTGSKFVYFSNRNALLGENYYGENRLHIIASGEDYSLGEIGYECLGWDDINNVYFYSFENDIVSVNTVSGVSKIIIDNANPYSVLCYPNIVSPSEQNSIQVYDIEDELTETIFDDRLVSLSGLTSSPNKRTILFQNQFYSSNSDRSLAPDVNIGIFNVTDMSVRLLNLPKDVTIQNCSWVSDEIIAVSVVDKYSDNEKTYLVDVEQFR